MKDKFRRIFKFVFGQKVYVDRVIRPYILNIQKEGRFAGKVAVITGGGGSIGRATACRLALEGATVVVCGRSKGKLDVVVDEIKSHGCKADAFACDVMKEEGVAALVQYVVEKYGSLDYWCNVAGGSSREKVAGIDRQEESVFDSVISTNLTGTLLCCKHAAIQMKKQNRGKIINTGSTVGIRGLAQYSEYAASKAAVMAMTESLAMELGKFGINVNCVTPGIVQRDMIADDNIERIKNTNFLHSYCTPEDIASMIAYLLSEEANFITGQNFVVDGGRSLGMKGC